MSLKEKRFALLQNFTTLHAITVRVDIPTRKPPVFR
jgi:hypothetical protein